MGLDCYSSLIIGEKIIKKTTKEIFTRYNEITGDPYKQEIEVKKWFYENDNIEFINYNKYYEEGDYIHQTYCTNDVAYVGIVFKSTTSHRHDEPSELIDLSKFDTLKSKYLEVFQRNGNLYMLTILCY